MLHSILHITGLEQKLEAVRDRIESYEPAIPDVTVQLEGLGPDGQPNTADDRTMTISIVRRLN